MLLCFVINYRHSGADKLLLYICCVLQVGKWRTNACQLGSFLINLVSGVLLLHHCIEERDLIDFHCGISPSTVR